MTLKAILIIATLIFSQTSFGRTYDLRAGDVISIGRDVVTCERRGGGGHSCVSIDALEACERQFDGDTNESLCSNLVSEYCVDSDVINACGDEMDGDRNELKCVEIAGQNRLGADIVKYCADSKNGDTAELACMSGL